MAVIWGHSMIPASGSSEESRIVGEIVKPVLEVVVGKGNVTDHLVRKLAHFTEYMVLGCLMGANVAVRVRMYRGAAAANVPAMGSWFFWSYGLLLCLAVAVIDESIQIFSPGRGPQVTDVLLDTSGSLAGMVAMWVAVRLRLIRH